MKINEFKLAYGQINPNANMYSLDFDAERMFVLLVLFFSLVLINIHRGFHDV
jgi:hypothetical protein